MATRRLHPEHWSSSPTRIQTRSSKEPRDERPLFPKGEGRKRPAPMCLNPGDPSPVLNSSPTIPVTPTELDMLHESLPQPEIVDVAPPNTWPRHSYTRKRTGMEQLAPPSRASQWSACQSEVSLGFGVLDYYLRDPSIDYPPSTPRLDTPIIDPGLEKFDFGLPLRHNTPSPRIAFERRLQGATPPIRPGAEVTDHFETIPTPLQATKPQPQTKNSYRLFPVMKDTSPPRDSSVAMDSPYPRHCTPTSNIALSSNGQPDPSYRPRRESQSSSVRSRKDSFIALTGTKRIPLRMLSDGSAIRSKRSPGSGSSTTTSPPGGSRWSEDTITSPIVATTPGPRRSFGPLLNHSSSEYPDDFFESDDEAAPLRRKFTWKRSASLTQEQRARKQVLSGDDPRWRTRFQRIMLCVGCCVDGE